MTNYWIIEVLADLKSFATENGMSELAVQLEDTALVATAEISSRERGVQELANWKLGSSGAIHRTTATR